VFVFAVFLFLESVRFFLPPKTEKYLIVIFNISCKFISVNELDLIYTIRRQKCYSELLNGLIDKKVMVLFLRIAEKMYSFTLPSLKKSA